MPEGMPSVDALRDLAADLVGQLSHLSDVNKAIVIADMVARTSGMSGKDGELVGISLVCRLALSIMWNVNLDDIVITATVTMRNPAPPPPPQEKL